MQLLDYLFFDFLKFPEGSHFCSAFLYSSSHIFMQPASSTIHLSLIHFPSTSVLSIDKNYEYKGLVGVHFVFICEFICLNQKGRKEDKL